MRTTKIEPSSANCRHVEYCTAVGYTPSMYVICVCSCVRHQSVVHHEFVVHRFAKVTRACVNKYCKSGATYIFAPECTGIVLQHEGVACTRLGVGYRGGQHALAPGLTGYSLPMSREYGVKALSQGRSGIVYRSVVRESRTVCELVCHSQRHSGSVIVLELVFCEIVGVCRVCYDRFIHRCRVCAGVAMCGFCETKF